MQSNSLLYFTDPKCNPPSLRAAGDRFDRGDDIRSIAFCWIHPLPLLVALVVVLVASRSLVVVAAPPPAGASSDGRGGGQRLGFTPTKQGILGRETQCLWEVMSLLWMGMSLFMDENVTFMDENVSFYG